MTKNFEERANTMATDKKNGRRAVIVSGVRTPFVKSFTPVSGPTGTQITVTGTGFTGANDVSWPGGEGGEHGGGGLVNETVELVFGEFDVTYMQQANDDPGLGIALGSSTFCWDVTDNKEIGGSPSGALKIVRKQFIPSRHYPIPTVDE